MELSDRIRKIYRENCKGIKDFAKRIGVSESSVNKWLAGEVAPKKETIKRIAEVFGVSEAWIMFGDIKEESNFMVVNDQVLKYGDCENCERFRLEIQWLRQQLDEKSDYVEMLKEELERLKGS